VIRAAVIGLGRAGCGAPGDPPRSHIGAILATKGMALAVAADPSPQARENARETWNLPSSVLLVGDAADIPEGMDVIAVASPTAARRQTVPAALKKNPKVLIVEKPLAATLAEAEELAAQARAQDVMLRVNFNRRLDPGHQAFRAALTSDPRRVVLRYGKGLFNYASHMVDLLIDWFGPIEWVQAFAEDEEISGDPSITFRVRSARGFEALFAGMDGLNYDQFEAEFYLSDQRLDLAAGGVEKRRYRAMRDRFYKGYSQLGPAEDLAPPQIVGGFRELYESVRAHLEENKPLAGCGPEDALQGLAVLEAALASARSGGKRIPVATMRNRP
jgi:predicted dehydrogenase